MGINDHDTFSGLAPLHKAAADGDLAKVIELMDDGADVDIRACGEVRDRVMRSRAIDSCEWNTCGSFCGGFTRAWTVDARGRRRSRGRGVVRFYDDVAGRLTARARSAS